DKRVSGPGNVCRLMAEHDTLSVFDRNGCTAHDNKRPSLTDRSLVKLTGGNFLANASFAEKKNRRRGIFHALQLELNGTHCNRTSKRRPSSELIARGHFSRTENIDPLKHSVNFKRFGNIVIRTGTHQAYGLLDFTEGREEDHRCRTEIGKNSTE